MTAMEYTDSRLSQYGLSRREWAAEINSIESNQTLSKVLRAVKAHAPPTRVSRGMASASFFGLNWSSRKPAAKQNLHSNPLNALTENSFALKRIPARFHLSILPLATPTFAVTPSQMILLLSSTFEGILQEAFLSLCHPQIDFINRANRQKNPRFNCAAMEKFREEHRATFSVIIMALMGIRRGLQQKCPSLTPFARANFRPRFIEMLATPILINAMTRLKDQYRNPAAHGYVDFNAADTKDFLLLSCGRPTLNKWLELKTTGQLMPDRGTVHNLLSAPKKFSAQRII
jgi:hypothetical protein